MKQKDIAVIIAVIIVAGVASLLLSKQIFGTPKSRQQQVPEIQAISAEFQTPDPTYFNSNSKDITQLITIGPGNKSNPF